MLQLAVDGILTTSLAPLRFGIFLAIIVAGVSALYACYALYVGMYLGKALPGWTSVMMAVTVIGSMQLFMLGIIGEYLGRTLSEVRHRPDFIIEDSNISNTLSDRDEQPSKNYRGNIAC